MIKGIRYYLKYSAHRKIFRRAGINERDVFLASFPKSGNTWLRFILARAIYPEEQINLRNIQDYFPTVHRSTAEEIAKLKSPRYIKTHAPFFSLYPRCVYIYRDYRAVVVSAWFHAKNKTGFKGTLTEFIASPLMNSFGPWHWHVQQALEHQQKYPEKIYLLQYEKLLNNTVQEIEGVLNYCKIKPIITSAEIKENTSFGKLREGEKQTGSRIQDSSGQHFFRSGTVDDWKQHLPEEDEAKILDPNARRMMIKLGYLK